jgi:hypothetical protein
MERLAPIAGDDPAIFAERRRRVQKSMLEFMYDEKDAAFYDLREPGSQKLRVRTPTIFFPLALPQLESRIAERVIRAHFDREDGFAAPLPLPSVELRDAAFFAGEHTLPLARADLGVHQLVPVPRAEKAPLRRVCSTAAARYGR